MSIYAHRYTYINENYVSILYTHVLSFLPNCQLEQNTRIKSRR